MKRRILFFLGILLVLVSILSVSATYVFSNPSISQYSVNIEQSALPIFDSRMCEAGQDFFLQIPPLGCESVPVRSDLLEEQDVIVFCQISGIQLNPLIDIDSIYDIRIGGNGERPSEVSAIGYFPSRAALGNYGVQLNSPTLNNLGYAAITLKKQPNESAMPDFVEGNLTARIYYDIKDAFGIGKSTHYVPVFDSEEEWKNQISRYGFWDGRGYLKAESVDANSARVSIYSGVSFSDPRGGNLQRVNSVSLTKGVESGELAIPGFNSCMGGMTLKLEDVEDPDTRAAINVNGNYFEFQEGEKFLNDKCRIRDIKREGLVQKVNLLCSEDREGSVSFDLVLNPKIEIGVNGTSSSFKVGDKVYTAEGGEKSVYLAYIGSKNGFDYNEENLQIVLVALPGVAEKLSNEQLATLSRQITGIRVDNKEIPHFANFLGDALQFYTAGGEIALRTLFQGEAIKTVDYGEAVSVFGKEVGISGFSNSRNEPLDFETNQRYQSAVGDYNEVIEGFSQERYPTDSEKTLGEQAYEGAITLSFELNQKEDTLNYCSRFSNYFSVDENSKIRNICNNNYKLSGQESALENVEINGEVYMLSFEGIREPTFEDYGADVIVQYPKEDGQVAKTRPLQLRKGQIVYLDSEEKEFIQLQGVEGDSVSLRVSVQREGIDAAREFFLGTQTLKEGIPNNFGGKYLFTLRDTNLKKVAKVSVNPVINRGETTADLNFKIGIEKRAFSLTPEETRNRIKSINKTAEKLKNLQEGLDKFVQAGKSVCAVTSAVLTAKNFFSALSGDGIARQEVMRGEGGWYEKCSGLVDSGEFQNVEMCLLKKNDEIQKDVKEYSGGIQSINQRFKGLESSQTSSGLFGEDVVNTDNVFEEYVDSNYKDEVTRNIENTFGNSIIVRADEISIRDIISKINKEEVSLGEARDLQLNSRLLNSESEVIKSVARSEVEAALVKIWVNSQDEDTPTSNESLGGTYENKYENPLLRYYESGKYVGLPAIVPYDLENGWYAATKSVLPFGRSVEPYDDSGRVSNFYLCNVGINGREEFSVEGGDDVCQLMNLGTNQVYNQFPGLSKTKASRQVSCAIDALSDASRPGVYSENVQRVRINTPCSAVVNVEVGDAYVGTPDIQCQDFMSPSDCSILFNACDPFVCPSSRCDLGGKYPVDDVVQSGIVGSIALCYPNAAWEGGSVFVPFCATGVSAGVDGLSKVFDSYSQCLQTSLETGETRGICDEIQSVYLCDLGYRQVAPIAKYISSGLTSKALGQRRGGGEYLTARDAFDRAGESASYLSDYYASNSFKAFQTRSIESAGTEFCQSWISGSYPNLGEFFDALTAPDSPPQFHGTFDEITLTTATSPPTSHYKVFYNIYAGRDSRASYEVYLKGTGSYFGGNNFKRVVAAGALDAGDYTTETKDFTAPSGYQELCIAVNGQEECGFQKVSTSFGVDYTNDLYLQQQASQSNIESTGACISGTLPSTNPLVAAGSLTSPNAQTQAENLINPGLSGRGITRVCATENPGKGSDPSANTKQERWVDVGYCDQENLRCWLDTESVKNAIRGLEIENQTLQTQSDNSLERLRAENPTAIRDFGAFVERINQLSGSELINTITDNLGNVFFNHEKGYLFLRRADAYSILVGNFYRTRQAQAQAQQEGVSGDITGIPGVDQRIVESSNEINILGSAGTSEAVYPTLEFKVGWRSNLFYTYSGKRWVWSRTGNNDDWISVDVSVIGENVGESEDESNQSLDTPDVGPMQGDIIPGLESGEIIGRDSISGVKQEENIPGYVGPVGGDVASYSSEFDSVSGKNREFIRSLVGKSYKEGIKLLIVRVLNDDDGFLSNPKISTGNVEFDTNSVFTFTPSGVSYLEKEGNLLTTRAGVPDPIIYLYFRYNTQEAKWEWSLDKDFWESSERAVMTGGDLKGYRPSSNEIRALILSLNGRDIMEGATIIFSKGYSADLGDLRESDFCSSLAECQKIAGERIIKIVEQVKEERGKSFTSDSEIRKDTNSKNLQCLMVQIADLESNIVHCKNVLENGFDGHPFDCKGSVSDVVKGDNDNSIGVMQINVGAHPDAGDVTDFETNVRYATNLLINNYGTYGESGVEFQPTDTTYVGWQAAIRAYNGLGVGGNNRYVEQVLGSKNKISEMFPDACA